MAEEEKTGKDHLKESRKHLEKGTQKFLAQGERKLDYYRSNRSELIQGFSKKLGDPKEPAVSGTIVLIPIVIVLLFIGWLFNHIAAIPGNQYFNISNIFNLTGALRFYVDQTFKLTVLLLLSGVIVTGVGRFVRTDIGFKIERVLDRGFERIPIIGTLYSITKVTTETVLGGADDLKKPVKIEVHGMRVTAFQTGNRSPEGKEILFVPTSPNITTGFVVEVEPEEIIETDENSEQALTRVLSAGFGDSEKEKEELDSS